MSERPKVPIATLLLVAANLIAAFVLLFQPELIEELGFLPAAPTPRAAITSLFLHANLLHLLGNLVFLAAVGTTVETATGSLRYVLVYFASGLAGVLAHLMLVSGEARNIPLIGASGCVAGLIGYYSARYTGVRIQVLGRRSVPIIWIVGLWVGLQILGAVVHLGTDSSVSFWAHLGGLATGVLLSLLFWSPDSGHRSLGRQKLDEMTQRSPVLQLKAAKEHLKGHPDDLKGYVDWLDAAHKMDDHVEETEARLALLNLDVSPAVQIKALAGLGSLSRLTSIQRRQLADRLSGEDSEASEALWKSILEEPGEDPSKPEALFSLIQFKWEIDPEYAHRLLKVLEDHYPHHGLIQVARMRGWMP